MILDIARKSRNMTYTFFVGLQTVTVTFKHSISCLLTTHDITQIYFFYSFDDWFYLTNEITIGFVLFLKSFFFVVIKYSGSDEKKYSF